MKRLLLLISIALILTLNVSSQTNINPTRDVLRIDQDWANSGLRRDAAALTMLNVILAEDYTFTGVAGDVLTKEEYLREQSDVSFITEDVSLRLYGDAALVTGHLRFDSRATLRRGASDSSDGVRYTNIYIRQQNKWHLVATQFSPVRQARR